MIINQFRMKKFILRDLFEVNVLLMDNVFAVVENEESNMGIINAVCLILIMARSFAFIKE